MDHVSGAFSYLPGGLAFSNGVAASPGYRISEWEFSCPLPVSEALERISAELSARSLAWDAVVGLDLRSPTQFSATGFDEFNNQYVATLSRYYPLAKGELPPFTRTNVTPVEVYLSEPCIRSVQIVEPHVETQGDFLMSGVAENNGAPTADNTVAYMDTSTQGVQDKVRYVTGVIVSRLAELKLQPEDVRDVDVYTTVAPEAYEPLVLDSFHGVAQYGLHRWAALPPVAGLDFEMTVKRVSNWLLL